jgi:hypothetical protein
VSQVATVKTVLTPAQALGALAIVLPSISRTGLNLIAAQSATETASWKSMHNWNMGNVTPTAQQVAAGVPWMDQGIRGMKYIAFPDPVSGSRAMVGWLQYHGLLGFAQNGDLDGYMSALRAGCYLGCIGKTDPTGHTVSQTDYDNYRANISGLMSQLSSVTPVAPPVPSTTPIAGVPPWLIVAGVGAVAGLAAWLAVPPAPRRRRRAA